MAIVTLDSSEYDMLRENKRKAEEEVKELKETIKSLEDKSRVILTTQYTHPLVDYDRICSTISHVLSINLINTTLTKQELEKSIRNIIALNIKFDIPYLEGRSYSSYQYIGFDDVKVKVEEHYKKEIEKAISDYKESEEHYHKLENSVEETVREKYSNTINKLKEKIQTITESKDTDIKALQDKITELSKSKEEKIAELMATIKEAQSKLEELSGAKKKGLFNKIFR